MRIGKSFIETVNVFTMEKYSISIQLQDKTQLPGEIYITCNNTVLVYILYHINLFYRDNNLYSGGKIVCAKKGQCG